MRCARGSELTFRLLQNEHASAARRRERETGLSVISNQAQDLDILQRAQVDTIISLSPYRRE